MVDKTVQPSDLGGVAGVGETEHDAQGVDVVLDHPSTPKLKAIS